MTATKPGLEKLFTALAPAKVNYVMPYAPGAKEQIAQYAKTADVAILNGDLDDSILAGENLKWIHCCHAGLDRSARPEVFQRSIILTSFSGRSAPALAQHAMLFLEALTYELPMLFKAQQNHKWAANRGTPRRWASLATPWASSAWARTAWRWPGWPRHTT